MLDEGEGVSKLLADGALFVLCYSVQHEIFPKPVYIFFDRQYGDHNLSCKQFLVCTARPT